VKSIACPFCGVRELSEFDFHKTLAAAEAGAFARVYERTDRVDRSIEHWQHTGGCRSWLRVRRNPSTGEIHEVDLLGGAVS
jgi:methylglutamate dehydrogenase subunit B